MSNDIFDYIISYYRNIRTAHVSIDNCIKERLARIRKDYNQKCRQSILKQKPRFISIEDLNIKGLIKNKHLSKTISKAQWYRSRLFLQNQHDRDVNASINIENCYDYTVLTTV